MKTITYHRARIVDRREIFKPKTSPIIQEAGKHQRSLKLIDNTLFFEMRVYHSLIIFFNRLLRSSRRTNSPPFKWMQENLLLTVCRLEAWASWNDLYWSHEELQWIHKCCDLQCDTSVPVIYCFISFRMYWYLLRATKIIWTVHIGVVILGVKFVHQIINIWKKILLRKIQKLSEVKIFMIRTSEYRVSGQTKGEISYAWQSTSFT